MKNAAKPQLVAIAIVVSLTALIAGFGYTWVHRNNTVSSPEYWNDSIDIPPEKINTVRQ